MTANPQFADVKIATTPQEREAVFRLRYDTFVELWGKRPPTGDAKKKTIEDELDTGATLLYVEKDGAPVATLRVNFLNKSPLSERQREIYGLNRFFERFPPEALSMSSQLFVRNKWRESEVVAHLLGFAYTLLREAEVQFDFRLCPQSLTSFYELLGYRHYKDVVREESGGHRVPMVCVLDDEEYFGTVDSPLYHLARRYENSPDSSAWFTREFIEKNKGREATGEEVNALVVGSLSSESDADSVPLFKGLSDFEVKEFVDAAQVTEFKKGETIVKAGYEGNELFVVLRGAVEARGVQNGVSVKLGTFGAGETFGEISFLMHRKRTADVVAISDGRLLEVSQAFLEQAMKRLPFLTNRVLLNLSVILCERLCSTTVQLLLAKQKA